MREIKFRAWIPSKKFMGTPFELKQKINLQLGVFSKETILLEYTGLKDKNGVEIYEGDILKSHSRCHPSQVVQVYCGEWAGVDPVYGFNLTCAPYEVIGNIYENPELLKEEHK